MLNLRKQAQIVNNSHYEEPFIVLSNVSKRFGKNLAIQDLNLEIKKGEWFSLLGPSGSGKTTVLRLIAGLEKPDSGEIIIGNKVVSGKQWVPPEKRKVGLVFQDYALFPHMRVYENVAFGLRGLSKREVKDKVMELLELVGLADVYNKYPYELSGGQQQRVALARALATSPDVMLLDEPFSNLDADLRAELRTKTKQILKQKGITTILVTHDQEEAFSLSDRVGVLNAGKLEQVGTPEEIYHRPKTRFVADFVGKASFVKAKVEGDLIISSIGIFRLNDKDIKSKEVEVMIRPDDVDFSPDEKGDAIIEDLQFLGPEVFYQIRFFDGTLIYSVKPSKTIYSVGTKVKVNVDFKNVVVFEMG